MIHYNVWFTFKDGVEERDGLAILEDFLSELCLIGEVSAYRLLKNTSEASRTKLPKFHAIIEFSDEAALSRAMKNQNLRGIHQSKHGKVIEIVSDFRVEIFRVLAANPTGATQYACEI
jgi:hypothetical protein